MRRIDIRSRCGQKPKRILADKSALAGIIVPQAYRVKRQRHGSATPARFAKNLLPSVFQAYGSGL